MENSLEKHRGLVRFFNVLMIVLIIGAVCTTATYLSVFVSAYAFGGVFSASSDGLLGFFLETLGEGERYITGKDLALSAAPSIFGLVCMMLNFFLLKSFLGRSLKNNTFYYKGAKAKFVSMTVICFLWAIIPRIISEYAVKTVDNDFFKILQWNVVPYAVIAVLMLAVTLVYNSKAKKANNNMIGE